MNNINEFLLTARDNYVALNRCTTGYLTKLFSKNTKIQNALNSGAGVLLVNAAILALIGSIFSGVIGRIALILVFINIVIVLLSYFFEERSDK